MERVPRENIWDCLSLRLWDYLEAWEGDVPTNSFLAQLTCGNCLGVFDLFACPCVLCFLVLAVCFSSKHFHFPGKLGHIDLRYRHSRTSHKSKHVRYNPDVAPRLTSGGYEDKVDVITPINILFRAGGDFYSLMEIKLMLLPQSTYCSEGAAIFNEMTIMT